MLTVVRILNIHCIFNTFCDSLKCIKSKGPKPDLCGVQTDQRVQILRIYAGLDLPLHAYKNIRSVPGLQKMSKNRASRFWTLRYRPENIFLLHTSLLCLPDHFSFRQRRAGS